MKNLKFLRVVGLTVFVASVVIFIATLFIGSYTLTESVIEENFASKPERVLNTLIKTANEEAILNKKVTNPFSFANANTVLLESYNTKITTEIEAEKGLTEAEINQVFEKAIANDKVNYSKAILENVFQNNPDKLKVVDEATNWMYASSKTYDKAEDFKNDFKNKIGDINRSNAQEFLLYDNKYSKYTFH